MKLVITTDSGKEMTSILAQDATGEEQDKILNAMVLELICDLMEKGKLDPENVNIYVQYFIAKKKGIV